MIFLKSPEEIEKMTVSGKLVAEILRVREKADQAGGNHPGIGSIWRNGLSLKKKPDRPLKDITAIPLVCVFP